MMSNQLDVVKNLCISLQKGLSTDAKERKLGEDYISSLESNDGYACLLLSMIAGEFGGEYVNDYIKLPLILTFKNFFKKNYKLNEAENLLVIPENDVNNVRRSIINVSLLLPTNLSCHMDATIGIIAKRDFPANWPSFLEEIVTVMGIVDVDKFTRFLKIIHGALKKYRYEFKSNELWLEIKYVIDLFGPVLIKSLNHFQSNLPVLNVSSAEFGSNSESLQNMQFISSLVDCYHDLIAQEIPDYLVDHLDVCMKLFFSILSSEALNVALNAKNEALKNRIIKCYKKIITVIILFVQSYENDIKSYLPGFIEILYKLAIQTPKIEEYDKLNSAIIKLFFTISIKPFCKNMLSDINTIGNICSNVIISNAPLRETEVETFEDEPDDYILKDIECGDLETKRKAVTELIRQLIVSYGDSAVTILNNHIEQIMSSSFLFEEATQTVKIANWLNVDLVIYLIISSAIIKESHTRGPFELYPSFDINAIFQRFIAPLLLFLNPAEYPVLKADTLKFIHIFRNFINPTLIDNILPNILKLLTVSNSKVINSYVYIISSDLLTKNTLAGQPLSNEALEHKRKVLVTCYSAFYKYFEPTQNDNIYQLQWLIKWLNFFNVNISIDFLSPIADRLIELLNICDKLTVSPAFMHHFFEAVCLVLWIFKCLNSTQFENAEIRLLNTIMYQIVQNDSNIVGYAFQVYSLFLKLFNQGLLSSLYVQHYSVFLTQELWMCKSNVPGLCQIMNSYLIHFPSLFSNESSIRTTMDLYKYCLTLSHMDGMSVSLAKNIVVNLPYDTMKTYVPEIMSLAFKRLAIRRTYRYTQDLLNFIFQFVALHGLIELKTIFDSLDTGLLSRFIQKVLIVELVKPIHLELFKKLLITLSLLILEQSLSFMFSSEPNLWWSLFKCTLESITYNRSLFAIDSKLEDVPIDNETDTIDHIAEDESFNRLQYAFASKLTFSGDVCCANKKTVSFTMLQQYDLKPTIQKIFTNSAVNSQIAQHITSDTIKQIKTQILSQI